MTGSGDVYGVPEGMISAIQQRHEGERKKVRVSLEGGSVAGVAPLFRCDDCQRNFTSHKELINHPCKPVGCQNCGND